MPAFSTVAFVGLGTMGLPMATNLAKIGADLIVWSRTARRARPLAEPKTCPDRADCALPVDASCLCGLAF